MSDHRVRLATAADAEAICRIYNQGIEDRVATLETELRTPEERHQWLAGRSPRHPVVVAESADGSVAGWASLNVFNPREAYRHVTDISVYVERAFRGKGIGRILLARLVELGREHGFHKLVLSAFPTNTSGMALYETLGFPHDRRLQGAGHARRPMGGYHRHGAAALVTWGAPTWPPILFKRGELRPPRLPRPTLGSAPAKPWRSSLRA